MKDMRVNKREDWYRCLDANDDRYGVACLAICDQQALLIYLQRNSYRLPQGMNEIWERVDQLVPNRYDQLQLMIRFYQCYPAYYPEHVVASGVLEPPAGMGSGYFTTKEILERLEGAPVPRNYAFGVGEPTDGKWSKAIAMLREKIGLSPEGGYTQGAAEKLYLYGKAKWRIGRGYLYSDNNPEVLFDNRYQEYISVVNGEVWALAGLDINYFHEDTHEIWKIITPGMPMYDMHGRVTGEDPEKAQFILMPWRIATAYSNVVMQNRVDNARAGIELPVENEGSIEIQREIWAISAEVGYGIGLEFSWFLLTHALSPYPEDVIIEENVSDLFDEFIEKVKNSPEFDKKINTFLQKKSDSFSQEKVGLVSFSILGSMDLYLALHNCTVWLSGEKNEDGTWNLEVLAKDKYDFDYKDLSELESLKEKASWFINNMAHFSQESGSVTPYDVEIHFTLKNYEVKTKQE